MWYIYIVKCSDNTLYTGITNNLEKRIATHNNKKGAKYTKTRLPVTLMAYWEASNRSEASKEEYRIKKLSRASKMVLICDWSVP